MSTVAIFCCARAEPLKKVISKTAGKMIRKTSFMGTGKQNFRRTPTENWRVHTPASRSWLGHLQQVKLLGGISGWRIGENELALAAETVGRDRRPQSHRCRQVGRGQHGVVATVRAADTTQDETAAGAGRDAPEKGRRQHRQGGHGTGH